MCHGPDLQEEKSLRGMGKGDAEERGCEEMDSNSVLMCWPVAFFSVRG